jgi:hypothetical protein
MDIVTSVITFKFSALNYSLILLNFQQDFYKINCDETFLADSNSGGWGFVIRDHTGQAVAAGAHPT